MCSTVGIHFGNNINIGCSFCDSSSEKERKLDIVELETACLVPNFRISILYSVADQFVKWVNSDEGCSIDDCFLSDWCWISSVEGLTICRDEFGQAE